MPTPELEEEHKPKEVAKYENEWKIEITEEGNVDQLEMVNTFYNY